MALAAVFLNKILEVSSLNETFYCAVSHLTDFQEAPGNDKQDDNDRKLMSATGPANRIIHGCYKEGWYGTEEQGFWYRMELFSLKIDGNNLKPGFI